MTKLIGGNISDTPIKDISDGSAFSAGGGVVLPGDPYWSSVKLLIQPHAGESSTEGLTDKGPDGRTPTIVTGSVAVVDDADKSPSVWGGAYLDPNNVEVTYSDDAGLQFGTGEFCVEIVASPTSLGQWGVNSAWGAASQAGSASHGHHFNPYLAPTVNAKWYVGSATSWSPNTFTAGDGYIGGGDRLGHWVFERGSDNVLRGYFNGWQFASLASHTLNYNTDWDAFRLFASWGWGSRVFSFMNMVAFRFTHAARYGGNEFSPLWGFPEAAA